MSLPKPKCRIILISLVPRHLVRAYIFSFREWFSQINFLFFLCFLRTIWHLMSGKVCLVQWWVTQPFVQVNLCGIMNKWIDCTYPTYAVLQVNWTLARRFVIKAHCLSFLELFRLEYRKDFKSRPLALKLFGSVRTDSQEGNLPTFPHIFKPTSSLFICRRHRGKWTALWYLPCYVFEKTDVYETTDCSIDRVPQQKERNLELISRDFVQ